MKLPAEVKDKWLKALRRKKNPYKQTQSVLYRPEDQSFCCLGVLQHCTMDGKVEAFTDAVGGFKSMPSSEFWEFVGAKDIRSGMVGHLMTMNDHLDKNFRQIANWIDKNIEAY